MTVGQLIEHLSRFDRDCLVILDSDGNTCDCPIPEKWCDDVVESGVTVKGPVAIFVP